MSATPRLRAPSTQRLHKLMLDDPTVAQEVKSLVHEALQEKAQLDKITDFQGHLERIDQRLAEANDYKREILGPVADLAQTVERIEKNVTAQVDRVGSQVAGVERIVDSALGGDSNAAAAAIKLGILTGLTPEELVTERKRIKAAQDGIAVMAWFSKRRVQVGAILMAAAAAYSFLFGNERAPGILLLRVLHFIPDTPAPR